MTNRILMLLCFIWIKYGAMGRGLERYIGPAGDRGNAIILTLNTTKAWKDSLVLETLSVDSMNAANWLPIKTRSQDKQAKFVLSSSMPVLLYTGSTFKHSDNYWIAEPGDSVVMNYDGEQLYFSGKGSEKFRLKYGLDLIKRRLKRRLSNPTDGITQSLQDFFEWNQFLNLQLELSVPYVDSYKDSLSSYAYNFIRNITLDGVLDNRSDKFRSFLAWAKKNQFPNQSICDIYDTTYAVNARNENLPSFTDGFIGSWDFIRLNLLRSTGFEVDKLPSEEKRVLDYYKIGSQIYSGLSREKFHADFLTSVLIDRLGFVPVTDSLLNIFYETARDGACIKYVKEFEVRARRLKAGKISPDFKLVDLKGNEVWKNDFKGKIVVLDFWFTGCSGCIGAARTLKQIKEHFKDYPDVSFVSISVDVSKDTWRKSVDQGRYVVSDVVNLYTSGLGTNHPIVKDYNVNGYPALYLLDEDGKIVQHPLPNPEADDGASLIRLIEDQVAKIYDGPYVINAGNEKRLYKVAGDSVSMQVVSSSEVCKISSQTDKLGKPLVTTLMPDYPIEPSEFKRAEKMFVLSDIEGNLNAFINLLQNNGIIDRDLNWTFGNGHLVFNGDMFDRGKQVTECLWLIYSLEQQARKANGYVHFILGNHEIMNLNGDHRYSKQKYIENANRIGISYAELFGRQSELGKWLRSKNIVERIGDYLFVHGGISNEILSLAPSLLVINDRARLYLDQDSVATLSKDKLTAAIYNKRVSPFWYREYFLDRERKVYNNGDTLYKTPAKVIDEVLSTYRAKHIVTGHTIVSDTISFSYDQKVINVDTKHAEGKSEALLFEDEKVFRVNQYGYRTEVKGLKY